MSDDIVFFVLKIITAGFLLLAVIWVFAFIDILYCFLEEGRIKTVMTGKDFSNFILNIKGKTFRMNLPDPNSQPDYGTGKYSGYDIVDGVHPKSLLTELLGLYYIGIPFISNVLKHKFSWNKYDKKEGEDTPSVTPRFEYVNSILGTYPYAIPYKDAETTDVIHETSARRVFAKVNMLGVFDLETLNPYVQLFKRQPAGNWIQTATALINEAMRGYASVRSYDSMMSDVQTPFSPIGEGGQKPSTTFQTEMLKVNGILRTTCGVRITNAYLVQVEQTKDLQQVRDATIAVGVAIRQGEARVAAARAQKDADTLIGEGKAAALRAEMTAMSERPEGITLRRLEALEGSKLRAIGVGTMAMIGLDEDDVTTSVPSPTSAAATTTPNANPQPAPQTPPPAAPTPQRQERGGKKGKRRNK